MHSYASKWLKEIYLPRVNYLLALSNKLYFQFKLGCGLAGFAWFVGFLSLSVFLFKASFISGISCASIKDQIGQM